MSRPESPKPPVAPKPRTTGPLTPGPPPKFLRPPRPHSLHGPHSMSRGPKPPLAPKPHLAALSVGSLGKCGNGLICGGRSPWPLGDRILASREPPPPDTSRDVGHTCGASEDPGETSPSEEDGGRVLPPKNSVQEEDCTQDSGEDGEDQTLPPLYSAQEEDCLRHSGEDSEDQALPPEDSAEEDCAQDSGEDGEVQTPSPLDSAQEEDCLRHSGEDGEDQTLPPVDSAEEDCARDSEEDGEDQALPPEDSAQEEDCLRHSGEDGEDQALPPEDSAEEDCARDSEEDGEDQALPPEDSAQEEDCLRHSGEDGEDQALPPEDSAEEDCARDSEEDGEDQALPPEDSAQEEDCLRHSGEDGEDQALPPEDSVQEEDCGRHCGEDTDEQVPTPEDPVQVEDCVRYSGEDGDKQAPTPEDSVQEKDCAWDSGEDSEEQAPPPEDSVQEEEDSRTPPPEDSMAEEDSSAGREDRGQEAPAEDTSQGEDLPPGRVDDDDPADSTKDQVEEDRSPGREDEDQVPTTEATVVREDNEDSVAGQEGCKLGSQGAESPGEGMGGSGLEDGAPALSSEPQTLQMGVGEGDCDRGADLGGTQMGHSGGGPSGQNWESRDPIPGSREAPGKEGPEGCTVFVTCVGPRGPEEPPEERCQVVPFEGEGASLKDTAGVPGRTPFPLFLTESTSFLGGTGPEPPDDALANPYDLGGPSGSDDSLARARSHSGKLATGVPETVPEEAWPESGGAPQAQSRPPGPHPRSFSVEAREPAGASCLSLPCALGSSGSFSRRPPPSSGTSTPSSLVDIPPPFELACYTRRPVTKSSPSLLAAAEPPEKPGKKKKSSFKRFLALTFGRRPDGRTAPDASPGSPRAPTESTHLGPAGRRPELDGRGLGGSPRTHSRGLAPCGPPFPRVDGRRRAAPFSRAVSRVESFEDRARPPLLPLPLTKPRSVSFPNADTSEYENMPAAGSDYENVRLPPARPPALAKLFEDRGRSLCAASENDGYVDMSSFTALDSRTPDTQQDTESAYTEPYKVCSLSAAPREDLMSEEEQGSSEEEDRAGEPGQAHQVDGQSRAQAIAQDLLSSEKAYVELLQHLHLDLHGPVLRVLGDVGLEDPEEWLCGLGELPALHALHRGLLAALDDRLLAGDAEPRVAEVFLAREDAFQHHAVLVQHLDRGLSLLAERCLLSPRLATVLRGFESPQGSGQSVKHCLLRVVQRVFQYQVLLTDYLNNLCPDSMEYQSTQGALSLITKITDHAHERLEQGENLQKLVHIEHSVQGPGGLLQPGREFLKEGTLEKVTKKSRRQRHLFLMSDVLLYTYPQKDGKYRLRRTLAVASMKVSRPVVDKVPYALRIETPECCLTLSASSCTERDEWLGLLSRAWPEDSKAPMLTAFQHCLEVREAPEARERLGGSLGERPPTLVPITHVMMCMNCGCDFSLTLRRHHCHACGKIVCRNCSRNKYPLKYLRDRVAKVCDGCYGELRRRGGDELRRRGGELPGLARVRPVSMSFPLPSTRFSSGAFSSVLNSIHPSTFRKQRKVPSALSEAAFGEGSAICGYLSRCKKGRRPWKKLWFVIRGKVLFTYSAREDAVAMESIPLLGFTVSPEKEPGGSGVGPVFHLFHKKTLFYSFRAEDRGSAQRWIQAMEDASVL